ncbi:hypothetical protein F8388_017348 [Cannabis sativa]|uniref:AAA-type ATPase N-terminal domain-containing protein n=1 Tax=Cannabis sativa TaxID=3483 RepID=A0A7J6H8Y2_CANSA|nr:hypothetical protein F8388_017348 [Cannabis sativa]
MAIEGLNSDLTLTIDKTTDIVNNEVFAAVELPLQTKMSPSPSRLRINKSPRQKTIIVAIDKEEKTLMNK